MIDLKLNDYHDLDLSNGDLQLIAKGEEVVQSAKIRLLIIRGEWQYDLMLGVPWFDMMFRTAYSLRQKTDFLRKIVLDTIGARRILEFEFGVDQLNRGSLIRMEIETEYGVVSGEVKA